MTTRRIELTSLQIKLLEVASMSYVDDCHNANQKANEVFPNRGITADYKYQTALYLHFLLSKATSLTLEIEDPHEVPGLVPSHRVYPFTSYKDKVTVPKT